MRFSFAPYLLSFSTDINGSLVACAGLLWGCVCGGFRELSRSSTTTYGSRVFLQRHKKRSPRTFPCLCPWSVRGASTFVYYYIQLIKGMEASSRTRTGEHDNAVRGASVEKVVHRFLRLTGESRELRSLTSFLRNGVRYG